MPHRNRRLDPDVTGSAPRAGGGPRTPADLRSDLFGAWVAPDIPVLLRVAITLTGQPADAEDLVQDTLLRAYRAVDRFDGQHPRAWLLTILRNAHRNRVRKRRPDLLDASTVEPGQTPAFGAPPRTPEQLVVDETFDAAIEEALEMLPSRFRQVVELVDVAGLSYEQTASVLDVPEGTVMSRLHRARNRLRADLAARGFAPRRVDR